MPVGRHRFKAPINIEVDKQFPVPTNSWLYNVTVHVPDDNGVSERVTVFYSVNIGEGRTDIPFLLIDGIANIHGISWNGKLPTEVKEGGKPELRIKFRNDQGSALETVELNFLWRKINE